MKKKTNPTLGKREKDGSFVKVVPDKCRNWITNFYFGIKGEVNHGHAPVSGAAVVGDELLLNEDTEILFYRCPDGTVLFDAGRF